MAAKYVYFFGNGNAEGDASMKNLLGGKGANLAEMTSIGLPVPPGFTISTDVCTYYYANDNSYPGSLQAEVAANLKRVGEILFTSAEALRLASVLLSPVLPQKAGETWQRLGWTPPDTLSEGLSWGLLRPGSKVYPGDPLFPRLE